LVQTTRSFFHATSTASADTPFRLSDVSIPFYEGNFHIVDENAYYGDMAAQEAPAFVGDVITFPRGDLADIFFKNYTGGSNTKIVFVGVVPTEKVKESLGL
jgi:hypothetical protein